MIGFLKKYSMQILKKHKLDFDEATKSKIPNKKTIASMEAVRKGEIEPTSLEQISKEWKSGGGPKKS